MSSKEELEKLTVAQIKEKLKNRKLPISGAKTDLINRLFDSIMAEENLLEEGPGGESIDLSTVNMDEMLGLDDEKDTHSSVGDTPAKPASENGEEPKTTKQTGVDNDKTPTKVAPANEEGQKTTKQASGGGGSPAKIVAPANEEELKAKRANRFRIAAPGEEAVAVESEKKPDPEEPKRKNVTEEDKKMLKRAERFGLPLKRSAAPSNSSEGGGSDGDEALVKRAKRFGLTVESGGGGEKDAKKMERAKRFGLAT